MKLTAFRGRKVRQLLSHPHFRSNPVRSVRKIVHWELIRLRDTEVTCSYDSDMTIRLSPRDGIGRWIYYFGAYEARSLAVLDRYLKPGMVFVDIGANIGAYVLFAAKRVGTTGGVIAFEPQRSVLPRLRHNIEVNDLRNVVLEPRAVGAASGTVKMSEQNDSGRAFTFADDRAVEHSYEVESITLDEYFSERDSRIDYLKIDVEGFEVSVLRGAERLFAERPPPLVQCEIATHLLERVGFEDHDLTAFLERYGYDLHAPNWDGVLRPVRGESQLLAAKEESREQTKLDVIGIHSEVDKGSLGLELDVEA